MTSKVVFFILFSIFVNTEVKAKDYKLNIHLSSHHFKDREDGGKWNSKNLGVGVEKCFDTLYASAGYFKNSYYKRSVYAGAGKDFLLSKFNVGPFLGLASGYPDEYQNIEKLRVIAGIRVEYNIFSVLLTPKAALLSVTF